MKTPAWKLAVALAAAAALTGGCGVGGTFGALQLVEPEAEMGRAQLRLTPNAKWLMQHGQISDHCRIPASDGTKLDVWIIQPRVPANTPEVGAAAVVLHPLTCSKAWFLSLGEDLARDGWHVVLPDLRAHGDSEGRYMTWGAIEKYDTKEIVDALVQDEHIPPQTYALGASLGGCIAIQYAAIDPRCRGVMALAPPTGIRGAAKLLSPFSSQETIDSVLHRASTLAAFDPENASAVDAAAKLRCPLILVHGIWDAIVPYRHSQKIYNAATGPRKLIPLYFADHTGVQVGRNKWIVKQMRSLREMAGQRAQAPATRP